MSSGKAMIIHLIAGLIKVASNKMSQYLPKPYETFGGDIRRHEVDEIHVGKLKTVPADLVKLRNVVNNEVVKKLCMIS